MWTPQFSSRLSRWMLTGVVLLGLLSFYRPPALNSLQAEEPERLTSLTDPMVKFTIPTAHHVVLTRGDITAVIVDNSAVDVPECPGHKAGYNGIAVLKHAQHAGNLFVPAFAGLNFEHIHDGTTASVKAEKFEPRAAPMQLRVLDRHRVELYQPATPHMQLESCGRYSLQEDGTIEYRFECIPHGKTFQNGYAALFWASYIQQPESTDIHFPGRPAEDPTGSDWIRGVTPMHGVESTHPPAGPVPVLKHDDDFPLSLVFHRSRYAHTEAWYYGLSHGRALAQMFRPRDNIWFAQSPSGGGAGNPAWDFQWFIPDPQVGQRYGFVMRASLIPSADQRTIIRHVAPHLEQLRR